MHGVQAQELRVLATEQALLHYLVEGHEDLGVLLDKFHDRATLLFPHLWQGFGLGGHGSRSVPCVAYIPGLHEALWRSFLFCGRIGLPASPELLLEVHVLHTERAALLLQPVELLL